MVHRRTLKFETQFLITLLSQLLVCSLYIFILFDVPVLAGLAILALYQLSAKI